MLLVKFRQNRLKVHYIEVTPQPMLFLFCKSLYQEKNHIFRFCNNLICPAVMQSFMIFNLFLSCGILYILLTLSAENVI